MKLALALFALFILTTASLPRTPRPDRPANSIYVGADGKLNQP